MDNQLLAITAVDFAFYLAIKSSFILSSVIATLFVLKKVSAATRHRVWGLTLVGLIAIVPLSLLLPQTWAIPTPKWTIADGQATPIQEASAKNEVAKATFAALPLNEPIINNGIGKFEQSVSPTGSSNSSTSATPLVAAIWLAGATFVLLAELRRTRHVNQLVAKSSPPSDNLQREFNTKLGDFQPPPTITLRIGTEGYPPFTAGIVRHFVVVPASAETWDKDLRTSVLQHELAHIRRRDLAWQMVARLACGVYWFHPLIWYGRKQMYLQSECATDDMVTDKGPSASTYATHLLHIATTYAGKATPSMTAMATPKNLESRIRLLLNGNRSHVQTSGTVSRRLLLLFAAVMIGVSMSTFSVTTIAQQQQQQQQQPSTTTGNSDSRTLKNKAEAPRTYRPAILTANRNPISRFHVGGSIGIAAEIGQLSDPTTTVELLVPGPDGDQRIAGINTAVKDGILTATLLPPTIGWPPGHARLRFQLGGMKTVEHAKEIIFFCDTKDNLVESPKLKPFVPLAESNLRHFDASQPGSSTDGITRLELTEGETVLLSGKFKAGSAPLANPNIQGPRLNFALTRKEVRDGKQIDVITEMGLLTTVRADEDEYWFEFPLNTTLAKTGDCNLTIKFTHHEGPNTSWTIPVHITPSPEK